MDGDSPAARSLRRKSLDEPPDLALNPPEPDSLPFAAFLRVYERSRQRLEDIISELQKQRNLQERLQERPEQRLGRRSRVTDWAVVSAAAAVAVGAALLSAQLYDWSVPAALISIAAVGGLSAAVCRAKAWRVEHSDPAALREASSGELSAVMEALERLERSLKELRAEETQQQRRRALHHVQINLPDAKFSINHLHLLLLRWSEGEEAEGEEAAGGGDRSREARDTLADLEQFVKLLQWAEQRYRDEEENKTRVGLR